MKPMPKKRGLNDAFKRFQRLPDWPIAVVNPHGQRELAKGVADSNNGAAQVDITEEEPDFTTLLMV